MKKLLMALFLSFVALGLTLGEAEAARFGGGRSFGLQRQMAPRPAPAQQRAAPGAPAKSPTAAPQRGWLGPVAGLAAGIGLAALFSHLGLGEEMANLVMIMLLVMAGMFVFRMLFRRNAAQPVRFAGTGQGSGAMPFQATAESAGSAEAVSSVPADFDAPAFLRVAKLNFVRLQAANDEKNLGDIREFTTPEMFAEIKLQMDERGEAAQQTDVVRLDAELLEVATEEKQHVASVRFSGLIREKPESVAAPFDEVWILTKPLAGDRGWVIAGIQQMA